MTQHAAAAPTSAPTSGPLLAATRPRLRALARGTLVAVVAAVALAACSASSPSVGPTPVVTASPVIVSTPEPTPVVTPVVSPAPEPSPTVYYEVTKDSDGGHGGPPVLDLPRDIAVDYIVAGTCTFTIAASTETSDAGLPRLTLLVTGSEMRGTWRFRLVPGRYYLSPSEAFGCTFTVRVYADR